MLSQVNLPINVLPMSFPGHGPSQAFNSPDDLPKNVARTLNQGSSPMSMDFHPTKQTLLLGILSSGAELRKIHIVQCFLNKSKRISSILKFSNMVYQLVPMWEI